MIVATVRQSFKKNLMDKIWQIKTSIRKYEQHIGLDSLDDLK